MGVCVGQIAGVAEVAAGHRGGRRLAEDDRIGDAGADGTATTSPVTQFRLPRLVIGFDALGVIRGGRQVEDLAWAQHVQQRLLRLGGGGDRPQGVRVDRGAAHRPAVGVPQRDGLQVPDRRRLDRDPGADPYRREAPGPGLLGRAGHGGVLAVGSQADQGVVQRGAAAQNRQSTIQVGDGYGAALVDEQIEVIAVRTPPPRLGVVGRRGVARRDSGVCQRPGHRRGVDGLSGSHRGSPRTVLSDELDVPGYAIGQDQSRISGRSSPVRRMYVWCSARLSSIC